MRQNITGLLFFGTGMLLAATSGCAFSDVDLQELACPCGTGWVCDAARNVCFRTTDGRDAASDTATDAGPSDAENDLGHPDVGLDAPIDAVSDVTLDTDPGDAGIEDSPDAGGGFTCEGSTSLLCEDFEEPSLTAWSATPDDRATSVVSGDRFHSGARALRSEVTEAGGASGWNYDVFPALTGGTLYARARMYFEAGSYDHITFFSLTGMGGGISLKNQDERTRVINVRTGEMQQGGRWIEDEWICWLFELELDAVDGSMALTVDGVGQFATTGSDTVTESGFTRVRVGPIFSGSDQATPVVFWMDDLEVATEPLNCD